MCESLGNWLWGLKHNTLIYKPHPRSRSLSSRSTKCSFSLQMFPFFSLFRVCGDILKQDPTEIRSGWEPQASFHLKRSCCDLGRSVGFRGRRIWVQTPLPPCLTVSSPARCSDLLSLVFQLCPGLYSPILSAGKDLVPVGLMKLDLQGHSLPGSL